jgi:hypothetical protein
MNKKPQILVLVTIVVVILSLLIVSNRPATTDVAFDINSEVSTIRITKPPSQDDESTGSEVASLSGSGTVRLAVGDYVVEPEGEKIDPSGIPITVDDESSTFIINPPYSQRYLASLINQEKVAILATLRNDLSEELQNYSVATGYMYEKGEWYGTVLSRITEDPRDVRDNYRILLNKNDQNVWQLAAGPAIILTAREYPSIPLNILKDINRRLVN